MQEGNNEYAISSSGNAAITATYIAKQYEIKLTIFLSENINNEKLKKIATFANESKNITIIKSKKPRSDLFKFIFDNRCINLRGSTDKYAQVGYESIATELVESGEDFDSIFIPASSGVSSIGVYNGFMKLGKKVQIHVCQTEKVNAIAKHFDFDFEIHNNSKADAITDKVGLRKREIIEIINTSKGFGWVISDSLLEEVRHDIKALIDFKPSYNSLLALAGLKKAISSSKQIENRSYYLVDYD